MQSLVHGETVIGKFYRRLKYLGEAHGAETSNRSRPGIDDRRYTCGKIAVTRDQVDPVLTAPVDGERFGGTPHTADGKSSLFSSGIN